MLKSFNKGISALLALIAFTAMDSSLMAWDSCDSWNCCEEPKTNRFYIGGFGGGLYSNSTKVTQMGTAFFTEAAGGPLAVFAEGHTKRNSTGFGGIQLGYEWSQSNQDCCSDWSLATAAELEGFFYSHNRKGHLINTSDRLPEHDFFNSFQLNSSVVLVNVIFALNNSSFFGLTPYVGGGIGATHLSLRKAKSFQVSPEEPDINHFNSRRRDSTWAFAAQVKAGLRYNISESFSIFGEYRYLFVDSTNYILGSTMYPNHVPTSPWNLKVKDVNYNAFAIGIQYAL